MSQRGGHLRKEARGSEETHLKVVRRRSRRLIQRSDSRRTATIALAGFVLSMALVFGILLEQVMLAQSAFQLNQLREEVAAAEQEHEKLLLKAASLDSPRRIERFARNRLGMVTPPPEDVKYFVADIDVPRSPERGRPTDPEVPASGRGEAALGEETEE